MGDNAQPQNYSDLLLGGSLEAILEATEAEIPRINESRFINEVLPLLERPFYHASLTRYVGYVGELTNELRVVSDEDHSKLLFTVPALIQTTGVTLPAPGVPTTDTTLRNIYTQADRGVDINPMIHNFMSKVAARPDMSTKLLDPLKEILARYGRTIDISDENNEMSDLQPKATSVASESAPESSESSFTGEYE